MTPLNKDGVAGPTKAVDRTAWDDTFAVMVAASEQTRVLSARQSAAWERAKATAPDLGLIDLSGFVGLHPFDPATYDVVSHEARQRAAIGHTWFPTAAEQARAFASYASVRAYQQAHQANLERHDVLQLWDQVEAVGDAEADAIDELLLMPAPDLTAVHWKLSYLFDQGSVESTPSWNMRMVLPVLEDVKRFADAAAAQTQKREA